MGKSMGILEKLHLVLFSATATSIVPGSGFSICPAPREGQCRAEPPAAPQWTCGASESSCVFVTAVSRS